MAFTNECCGLLWQGTHDTYVKNMAEAAAKAANSPSRSLPQPTQAEVSVPQTPPASAPPTMPPNVAERRQTRQTRRRMPPAAAITSAPSAEQQQLDSIEAEFEGVEQRLAENFDPEMFYIVPAPPPPAFSCY